MRDKCLVTVVLDDKSEKYIEVDFYDENNKPVLVHDGRCDGSVVIQNVPEFLKGPIKKKNVSVEVFGRRLMSPGSQIEQGCSFEQVRLR